MINLNTMKIGIWSDIACPYCYIGKHKLEQALEKFPHKNEIELVWHSYELNPELPKNVSGKSFYQFFAESHNMTIDEAKEDSRVIANLAKTVGLDYHFEKLVLANTSDALRTIKLAALEGKATEAEEVFFQAYFVDGKDVSNRQTILSLGAEIGLQKDALEKMLDSDRFLDDIKKDIEFSENQLNLEYIPFYLFNNKQIVQGSITSEEYLDVLTKSYNDWKKNGVSSEKDDVIHGKSCSINGVCNL